MTKSFQIFLFVSLFLFLFCTQNILAQELITEKIQATEKHIILANETSWPPHYGKELKNGGYTTEIISAAMAKVGYKVSIKWLSWNRAVALASKGIYDGLGACFYNQKRAKLFAYTDSLGKTETVFFKLKNKNIKFTSLEQLKGYKIGTAKGYGYPQKFSDASYLTKIDAPKIEFNIRKLLNARIDLVIGSKKVTQHLLNTNYPVDKNKIEIIQPPLEMMPLYVAFSKKSTGYEQKVKDFNRGLKLIKADGSYAKILKKHGF